MKNLLLIVSVLLSTSLSAVEYGYLYSSKGVEESYIFLDNNKVFEVINASHDAMLNYFDESFDVNELKKGKKFVPQMNENYIGANISSVKNEVPKPKVAGPLYIYLSHSQNRNISLQTFVWYKIYNISEL